MPFNAPTPTNPHVSVRGCPIPTDNQTHTHTFLPLSLWGPKLKPHKLHNVNQLFLIRTLHYPVTRALLFSSFTSNWLRRINPELTGSLCSPALCQVFTITARAGVLTEINVQEHIHTNTQIHSATANQPIPHWSVMSSSYAKADGWLDGGGINPRSQVSI